MIKKSHLFTIFLLSSFAESAISSPLFPVKPELSVTPGKLCDKADEHRYPEKIPYCSRNVSSTKKWEIIDRYDDEFGYEIRSVGREHFKIDHFIPLCMGGGNQEENLWPQHETVYEQTDPIEQALCVELSKGDISWEQAIDTIYQVKMGVTVSSQY